MVARNFMVKENFTKYLINIYRVFNIILPKPCEIFGKSLTKIQFDNYSNSLFNQHNSGNFGRMIYFIENSIVYNLSEDNAGSQSQI